MTVRVESKAGPYEVHISRDALEALPAQLEGANRVALIHSPPLEDVAHHVSGLLDGLEVLRIEVPDAEEAKTPGILAWCWDQLAEAGFTRNDVVVGLGGGTATDLAGFVAASWLRGVAYVSVPTSVLGMVDAAVGGKTGINLTAGKNLVGAFHEPRAVICDLSLLDSLPAAEVRSGMAEVIKCGFIADPQILRLVSDDLDDSLDVTSIRFAELVRRAITVKAEVVAADLTERTSIGADIGREALNYGHTLGHAIEARERFTLRHGEAISIGMVFMAEVSRRLLGLDDETAAMHRELLGGIELPLRYEQEAWPELRRLMSLDKKSRGSTLRLVGLSAQGRPRILADPDERVLEEAYASLA
ncbi:3-dehydroquinate synthase [Tessaracoccus rhinocerotis]|uniref:3-dehydroquinate synthase n=1 Tax=Tessaracoccus rhinocerotis TaxID=1689449 RepID=A0A553JY20_9ACTN|nr:3-dehydroquinate synthase [Tessaracoccus rhinocerotis]TRY17351.1 3-dehydroquinate synthase [Tessaracoccus rhinocerotis]